MTDNRNTVKPIPKNGSRTTEHLKDALKANSNGGKVLAAESLTTAFLKQNLERAAVIEVQNNQNASSLHHRDTPKQQANENSAKK
ncbi:hypothetical protein [Acidicapsa acidisoli]|uniref:hypothetical protein n=1 Tax=Acidicapsa acidisoli TaxID=1615681 RepID=UPI0021E0DF7A|nr:hypothetical protein [Acidicapsa acidisoli]